MGESFNVVNYRGEKEPFSAEESLRKRKRGLALPKRPLKRSKK